jgi:AcrR family transcriptional regulator
MAGTHEASSETTDAIGHGHAGLTRPAAAVRECAAWTRSPQKPRKDPRQERSRSTVDAILEAAGQLIERQEEAKQSRVSTTLIAERAGVSVGSLYQYFPNREALVAALLRRFVQKRFVEIRRVLDEVEPLPLEAALHRLAGRLRSRAVHDGAVRRSIQVSASDV